MVTISLCMIVKNEEAVLARCLDSLADLCEEIIIVDTGSNDQTKTIASRYTDKVYDFVWTGSFSDARNFSFSKATMEYIYCADADEVLDETNRNRFLQLKEVLLPEIEIVQMKYVEKGFQTVLNAQEEYRPKLYRRMRTFTWIDPVHETVRTLPVVFDSDIKIFHQPQSLHAARDFAMIEAAYQKEGTLSKNLAHMYARELYKNAIGADLQSGAKILLALLDQEENQLAEEFYPQILCVLAKAARLAKEEATFLKYTSKLLALGGCAEVCCELGDYFYEHKDLSEAYNWYYNAAHETESVLDSSKEEVYPKLMLQKLEEH